MSWLRLNEFCAGCSLVVGSLGQSTQQMPTNLVWDGEAETTDYDGDGLGTTLEAFIHTTELSPTACNGLSPSDCDKLKEKARDTDQDGLFDGDELLGRDFGSPFPPVKLATWGASPTEKDIFFEIDWQACPTCADLDDARPTE